MWALSWVSSLWGPSNTDSAFLLLGFPYHFAVCQADFNPKPKSFSMLGSKSYFETRVFSGPDVHNFKTSSGPL